MQGNKEQPVRGARSRVAKTTHAPAGKPFIRKTYGNLTSIIRSAVVFAFFFFSIVTFYNGPDVALLPQAGRSEGLWVLCAGTAAAAITSLGMSFVPRILEGRLSRVFAVGGFLLVPMVANAACQQAGMMPAAFALPCSLAAWVLFGAAVSIIISGCASYLYCTCFDSTTLVVGIGACLGTVLFAFLALLQDGIICVVAAAVVYAVGCASSCAFSRGLRQDVERICRRREESHIQRRKMTPAVMFSTLIQVVILGFLLVPSQGIPSVPAAQMFFVGCLAAALLFIYTSVKLKWVSDLRGICLLTMPVIMAGLVLSSQLGFAGTVICNILIIMALSYHYFIYWQDSISISRSSMLDQYSYHARSHSAVFAAAFLGMLIHAVVVSNEPAWGPEAESIAGSVLVVALCIAFLVFAVSNRSFYESTCSNGVAASLGAGERPDEKGDAPVEPSRRSCDSLDEKAAGTLNGKTPDLGELAGRAEDRCGELIERFALTDREAEVFMLLAKGRNAEFIMGELSISRSTVKSHIASIYRKAGIHKQQELITFVDGEE